MRKTGQRSDNRHGQLVSGASGMASTCDKPPRGKRTIPSTCGAPSTSDDAVSHLVGHDRCEEGDDPDESRLYGMLAFTPLDCHRKGDQQEEGPVEAKGDPSNPTDRRLCPWPATGVCGPFRLGLAFHPGTLGIVAVGHRSRLFDPARHGPGPKVTSSGCHADVTPVLTDDSSVLVGIPSSAGTVDQHGSSIHPVVGQVVERLIGLLQSIGHSGYPQWMRAAISRN